MSLSSGSSRPRTAQRRTRRGRGRRSAWRHPRRRPRRARRDRRARRAHQDPRRRQAARDGRPGRRAGRSARGRRAFDAERLRRAAGTALRELAAGARNRPSGTRTREDGRPRAARADRGEAEAVATGALLGGYTFRRYRATPPRDVTVTLLTSDDNAPAVARPGHRRRGQPGRDLVNTAPLDLPPATLAAEAQRRRRPASPLRCWTRTRSRPAASAGSSRSAGGHRGRRGWSGSPTPTRRRPGPSSSSARASRSTPAGCRSSRRSPWRR